MQNTKLTDQALGEIYETCILPQFAVELGDVAWLRFRRIIGPDNELHIFEANGKMYVLLFDDYPTNVLQDVAKALDVNPATLGQIPPKNPHPEAGKVVNFKIADGQYVHNVTGSF